MLFILTYDHMFEMRSLFEIRRWIRQVITLNDGTWEPVNVAICLSNRCLLFRHGFVFYNSMVCGLRPLFTVCSFHVAQNVSPV